MFNAIAFGKVDYGWCGFEKVFKTDGDRLYIESLKPLLHDISTILVTKQGHFNGYRQTSLGTGILSVDIFPEKCLHTAFGVEAGNYYGMPLLENIRKSCDDWNECNNGARRYDEKMAGSIIVMTYPQGQATIDEEANVDNRETAIKAIDAMKSGGSVVLPSTTLDNLQEITSKEAAEAYKWDVKLLEDKGKRS